MNDEEMYFDEEFIINLSIEGTSFEEVEVKVSDPQKARGQGRKNWKELPRRL